MTSHRVSLAVLLAAVLPAWGADAVDAGALRPGLVAGYRDTARPAPNEVIRLEPTIALALRAGEAPHPRLGAAGGSVRWEGYLNVVRAGDYRFRALVRGQLRLTIGGKEVVAAAVKDEALALKEGPELRVESGWQPLVAEFTRLPGAARVEVFWESKGFPYEPLPHDALRHLPASVPARLADDDAADHGRFLVEERNCFACHQPDDKDRIAAGLIGRQGPDLSNVGERVYAGWVYRWLEAPDKARPGAVMPRLFADDETGRAERYAVAGYLASLGGPLLAETGDAASKGIAERGRQLFAGIGCLACHKRPLTDLGAKTTPGKLAAYLMNPLAIDPSGRMPHVLLKKKEAEDLARYLCQEGAETKLPDQPAKEQVVAAFRRVEDRADELAAWQKLPPEARMIDLGKRVVIARGCNNCHTIAPDGKPFASVLASTTFDGLKKPAAQERGCLGAAPAKDGPTPWFALSAAERKSVRQFLTGGTVGAGSPAPAFAARVTMRRFNCLACHTRDGEGGLNAELVADLRRYEKAENVEAVLPPSLTGVAHKLRTPWLRAVLTEAKQARPWMSLRMPQFGPDNVGKLPEALAALEGTEPDEKVPAVSSTASRIAAGRQLVGKKGFGCISCHDLAGIANSGTRGPDLASMTQRVGYDWYRRWLEQPQRMSPGTRMPSVFTAGKSLVESVLGGSGDAQAEAMWAYLSLGPGLPLPDGVEPAGGKDKGTLRPMPADDERPTYPATRTDDVVETLHGVAVADPYRWLEDGDAPAVREWVQKQNAFTRTVLDKLPARDKVHERLGALLDVGTLGTPAPRKGRLFYTARQGKQNQPILYVRDRRGGEQRVLLDPNKLAADGTVALDWWYPSRDGKLLAYGLSKNGNEQSTLHVRDVATGEDRPDAIERTRACSLAWLPDGSGFYYTRYPGGENYNRRVFFHRLGDDPAKDVEVFGEGRAREDWPNVTLSPDGRWLVVTVEQGWAKSEVYFKDRTKDGDEFKPLVARVDAVYHVVVRDDCFYVHTNEKAPRYRLLRVNPLTPARILWKEILAEGPDVLDGVVAVGDSIVGQYMHQASARLRLFDRDGKPREEVKLPTLGSLTGLGGEWDGDELFFGFQSCTLPQTVYRLDLKTAKAELWEQVKADIDFAAYEVEQVSYKSKDGTPITMFLAHKKGLKPDGKTPVLLYGYGGFNVSLTPSFSASRFLFLERGGVIAIPNLRGGGEYGEEWHQAGMLGRKQNVFDDFIAAAEWLIAKGYTDREHLAIQGGSNGGLLVGAALTQRPDLFRAVVCQVPLLDMVRYHKFLIARLWVPEYGSAENESDFEWLYRYSPYHHVKDGTKYPAVLLATAESDSRVDALHARKMAARLQTATASDRPVLLRLETKAGHGAGKPRGKVLEELTDTWSFLFWQLGIK
ncbi:MAG TPA: prolyl oligopeptidase family serine peptidase [Gemmataceae bacterium]|nr:prolyl oligopeptidase family serine peptidase [Gemmataceae bacterium]